jgi:uncharacterized protein (DUF697 family)
VDVDDVGRPPESLWQRMRAQPERAPEHIALAAADRFGPQAARWVVIAGGGQTPEQLAKTAYKKHVRMSRLEGAALGLGGVFTAAADLVALAWIQSRMVFFIAAAYGYDPNHPMRPAELLALQGVYATATEAREALDGVGKPLGRALVEKSLAGSRDQKIAARLIRFAGKRAAQRYGGRLIPLLGAPIGAVENAGATKDLGRRTLAYYGGPQARP